MTACAVPASGHLPVSRIADGGNLHLRRQANREKNDYIISSQRERIAQQDTLIAEQERHLSATKRELAQKTEKLSNIDSLLADVSDAAYQQAVRAVTETDGP